MKKITYFTTSLSISSLLLLPGCAVHYPSLARMHSTLKSQSTSATATIQHSKTADETVGLIPPTTSGFKQRMTLHIRNSAGDQIHSLNRSSTSKQIVKGKPSSIIYFGPSSGRRIYITVDDGWSPSQKVLRLMQTKHVPITAFLIQKAAAEHLKYWKAFVKSGGVIEDHTVSHPWLTKVSYQNDLLQWEIVGMENRENELTLYQEALHIEHPWYIIDRQINSEGATTGYFSWVS